MIWSVIILVAAVHGVGEYQNINVRYSMLRLIFLVFECTFLFFISPLNFQSHFRVNVRAFLKPLPFV